MFKLMEDFLPVKKDEDSILLEKIIDDISKYDVFDFIAKLSSLNLLIENQNKSILFDVLVAGILHRDSTSYTSQAVMSAGKFRTIISKLEKLSIKWMIDPAENAFLERTRYYGNFWIFPGNNYSPAYCLQAFLDILFLKDLKFNPEFIAKAHQLINLVLFISNGIASKLEYNLDTLTHIERDEITIPSSEHLLLLKSCVCMKPSVIDHFVKDEFIYDSLFSDFGNEPLEYVANRENHNFYCSPFIKAGDNSVILLNPSILVPFAIHHLVRLADEYAEKEKLIFNYNEQIWRHCKHDLYSLGHRKIDESAYGITLLNDRNRKELLCTVGNNKLLFVHYICDAGDEQDYDIMYSSHVVNSNPPIIERIEYFLEKLPNPNNHDTYQIIVLNSYGRKISYGLFSSSPNKFICLSPFDLHCISVNERNRVDFIPRYIDAKSRLKVVTPHSLCGELNIIELYVSNNYSFYLSDDFDPKNTFVHFGLGDSIDYIIRAVKKEDRHLIEHYDGVHLGEIYLSDPARRIYIPEPPEKHSIEHVIKFDNIAIWLESSAIKTRAEFDLYYSISDTVSFWLSEAKTTIETFNFPFHALCIKLSLAPPLEEYHSNIKFSFGFEDCVQYIRSGNCIEMIWTPAAYQLLADKTNKTEKVLLSSVLKQLSLYDDNNSVVHAEIDKLFLNPLKKKVFTLDISGSPYLLPIDGSVCKISTEEEDALLDEIGNYFLEMPEYDYGYVPNDKRAELSRKVVEYLYSLLKREVSNLSIEGILEKICYDLECVMYHAMIFQNRYAFDISCYPERKDKIIEHYNEVNKASIALKFLAEYIAAVPPCGNNRLGSMQYERLLAICSLIIEWAYKNDLFIYNILNTPVRFLKSGRIGMVHTETDYLSKINSSARVKRLESLSDPRIQVYSIENLVQEFNKKIDSAFEDEYGFSFQQFSQCITAMSEYGNTLSGEVKCAFRDVVINEVTSMTQIPSNIVDKILSHISLTQRSDFLVPPKSYKKYDVYPWRFNRELSFTRRPIIAYKEKLIWGNRQLNHMLRYTTDLIFQGKYKAKGRKLTQFIGKLSNLRGNDFNSVVAKKLSSFDGLIVQEKVSKINGKRIVDDARQTLGDIDILCIIPSKHKIIVGEVKDFSFAKNPYEMNQEYRRIFVDSDKPCYITKHKRRVAWVADHLSDVIAHYKLTGKKWSIHSAMFVSEEIVSNEFYHAHEKIIVYSDITEKTIKSI